MRYQSEHIPRGWNAEEWGRLVNFAERSSTADLIAFTLLVIANCSTETNFRVWLRDMNEFSRNDILNVLDELDPPTVAIFLDKLDI
jgi:hypothetical protein